MDPITGALTAAGALISGFASLGESDQEKSTKEALNRLKGSYDWLKETPFSKNEIINSLIPKLQKMSRGAADVVAGRAASALGETNAANFSELYTQTLGDVIGQGEQNAVGIEADLTKWFGSLDDAAKNRFINAISLELQGSQGLEDMTGLQKFITSSLSGANIGATIGSNLSIGSSIGKQSSSIEELLKQMYKNNSSYTGSLSKSSTFKGATQIPDQYVTGE